MNDTEIVLAALAPYLLLTLGFAAFCLFDLYRSTSVRHLPKWTWALICLLATPWGGILYLVLGRDR
ncbi:PLDc N-terminal domain-containing protein [Streptomonospora salina]|uniref:Cardiolipin synthase N-terminal domain-containing protein n=1 Tax=Streptomonospora salina TaxID=104205 RepID=A0A841EJF0_9ACTN|nr:PLDc N-terminal domain-containing protein [Streptomonospora salina]MBB6000480.1 hypothetical protein [Streptomonospora salina]